MTRIGPHLLGRKPSPVDERDARYAASNRLHLLLVDQTVDESILDLTVREAIDQNYFDTWAGVRAFWRWLKAWRNHTDPSPSTPRRQRWNTAYLLDQGDTAHCTAFGSAHWGITDPVNSVWTAESAHAFYYREKELDGEPRAEDGSWVRTAGKVLLEQGRVAEYLWVARVDEKGPHQVATLTDWVLTQGPVIIGIDWYDGMFYPDAKGVIWPTGKLAGGHCLAVVGIDLDAPWRSPDGHTGTGLVEVANSWGYSWGLSGHAYITLDAMQRLLDANGEALAGLELPI